MNDVIEVAVEGKTIFPTNEKITMDKVHEKANEKRLQKLRKKKSLCD